MSLSITVGILIAALAVFALASWRAARPADPLRPRLLPWRPMIVAAGLVAILMLVHLVNLFGVETGRPGF